MYVGCQGSDADTRKHCYSSGGNGSKLTGGIGDTIKTYIYFLQDCQSLGQHLKQEDWKLSVR